MTLVEEVKKRLAGLEVNEVSKSKAMRRAEELAEEFSYIQPKTDVPTPERYFGLPSFSK
ncbi:hypothetical protein SAMN04515647_3790 [Cohaesibacter sp. ES.047]|uniref:hypothetical protein n=1 Tax=Cohaesibacter sp. ES.047 TaxID=1798205 RepID=UPI000BBF6D55|nr:hypothetical protein [Cohaesibacter sp. ES.047]SNY93493.1 hypothetical protein SAMN04515647_3790 [Cohaesibacter sp. ES.047]